MRTHVFHEKLQHRNIMRRKRMKKKTVAMLLACLLPFSGALTACGESSEVPEQSAISGTAVADAKENEDPEGVDKPGSEDVADSEDAVTLSLWIVSTNMEKVFYTKLFDMWEQETGNKVDVIGLPDQSATPLAKFTTGDIPDVMIFTSTAALMNFNPAENFLDWSAAEWVSDLADTSKAQGMYGGKLIGLPTGEASNSGCLYNKKIFAKYGIAVPTTQEEFDAACDKLLKNGVQPIYLPAGEGWGIFSQFAMDPIFNEHPEYLDELNAEKKKYSDIQEMNDMCQWYKNAAEKGYFGDSYASDQWDYNSEVLGTGEAAMIYCWDTWLVTDYDNDSYEYKADDFGIMPVFCGTRKEGTYEGGNLNLVMVPQKAAHVDVAKNLVNFMAVPEHYNIAYDGIPTSAIYKQLTTNIESVQYKENKDSVDRLLCSSVTPRIVGYSGSQHGKCLVRLMQGEIDVDECLNDMDEERIATLEALAD